MRGLNERRKLIDAVVLCSQCDGICAAVAAYPENVAFAERARADYEALLDIWGKALNVENELAGFSFEGNLRADEALGELTEALAVFQEESQ